jgi:hypothetical protein
LNAAERASDCTPAGGFNDFSGVVEFLVKKVTPDVWKPGKVCFPASIFFLQVSLYEVLENFFPDGFSLSKDHRIGVFQGLVRQSRYMESTQYHLRPFGPQAIGDTINIRHVVGQPHNQGQMAVFSVGDKFIRFVYETDMEPVRGQGGHRRKADGGIPEQGQADTKGLVACPLARCSGYEK